MRMITRLLGTAGFLLLLAPQAGATAVVCQDASGFDIAETLAFVNSQAHVAFRDPDQFAVDDFGVATMTTSIGTTYRFDLQAVEISATSSHLRIRCTAGVECMRRTNPPHRVAQGLPERTTSSGFGIPLASAPAGKRVTNALVHLQALHQDNAAPF